ncbi:hypothetical protein BZA77DRAFT_369074 [Pyronema omphalodes]|nr:hypothetical protein BZA77DRAFT_369074 [Pyronema omphalodes]
MDIAGLTLALPAVIFKLLQLISQIKSAPSSVSTLQTKLQSLSEILQLLQSRFNNPTSQHAPPAILTTIQTDLNTCLSKLQSLETKLHSGGGGWKGKLRGQIGRLRWPLNEDEMEKMVTGIANLVTVLGMAVVVLEAERQEEERIKAEAGRNVLREMEGRQKVEVIEGGRERGEMKIDRGEARRERLRQEEERKRVEEERKREGERLMEKKREKVIQWIFKEPVNSRHVHIGSQRKEGTVKWVFETPEYQQWISKAGSPVLLGCGIPGAGKTVLTSVVIDDLLSQPNHHAVAYIYFSFSDQATQTPLDILAILTKQLLSQLPSLPSEVLSLYDRHRASGKPNGEILHEILLSMPARFNDLGRRTFIICDALDETDIDNQRIEILTLLEELKNAGCELFLTSRPHSEDVRSTFQDAVQMDVVPDIGDVRLYAKERLAASARTVRIVNESEKLNMDMIIDTVADNMDGMFLLAKLFVLFVSRQITATAISKALADISIMSTQKGNTLEAMYQRIIDSIRSDTETCEHAFRTLSWVCNSENQLDVEATRLAISIDDAVFMYDADSIPHGDTIVDICGGLIMIEKIETWSGIIFKFRLAHYTVYEFLEVNDSIPEHLSLNHGYHVRTLCRYIEWLSTDPEIQKQEAGRFESLYHHTEKQLHPYIGDSEEEFTADTMISLLSNPAAIPVVVTIFNTTLHWGRNTPKPSSLHLACFFGHTTAASFFISQKQPNPDAMDLDVNEPDPQPQPEPITPLHLAILSSNPSLVSYLLSLGHSTNTIYHGSNHNFLGQSPLHLSISSHPSSLTLAHLLLTSGASISCRNKQLQTPLHLASRCGNLSVLELLLQHGADENAVDQFGCTPLFYAAGGSREKDSYDGLTEEERIEVVNALLDAGADLGRRDELGNTVLHHVVGNVGWAGVVEVLVERGVEREVRNIDGLTALMVVMGGMRWKRDMKGDGERQMRRVLMALTGGVPVVVPMEIGREVVELGFC